MFKNAKLHSLLVLIIASTVVALVGFSHTAYADVMSWASGGLGNPEDGIITYANEVGSEPTSADCKDGKYRKLDKETAKQYFTEGSPFSGGNFQLYECSPDGITNTSDVYKVIGFTDDTNLDSLEGTGYLATFELQDRKGYVPQSELAEEIKFDSTPAVGSDVDYEVPGEDKESPKSCQIKGVGWLICPVVNFLAEVTDNAYKLLDNTLLKLEPIALPSGSQSDPKDQKMQLYDSWRAMRDFANIIFIISFLVIVFSQITNVGISNYGLKRLLPKIVMAAILVNLSYYICAIAVDISNILGNELRGLLAPDGGATLKFQGEQDGARFDSVGFTGIAGVILGGVLTVGIIYAFLPVFLPLIITAAAAVMTVIIVLTLRQALVVILIIVSPLAFVALLLPNTENYFKKWKALFMAMLLVYPIVSVMFGASALASNILMSSTNDFWLQMVGAGVSVIPLFITPLILKASGSILSRWTGMVNDPTKGIIDSKRNALADRGEVISNNRKARGIARYGNFVGGTRGGALFGGANSRRRRGLASVTSFGERARKDDLKASENAVEGGYLNSSGGQAAGADLKQSEVSKHTAENRAQAAATRSVPHTMEAAAMEAEMENKAAENEAKTAATAATSGGVADRTQRRSELELKAAETGADANWAGQTVVDPTLRDLTQEVQTNQAATGVVQGVAGRRYNTNLASPGGAADVQAALGGVTDPDVSSAIDTARAEAEDKEISRAQQALQEEVAQVKAGTHATFRGSADDFLANRARDTRFNDFERGAAMYEAARLGRSGVISDFQNGRPAAGTSPAILPLGAGDQARVRRAIDKNAGQLAEKAPDIVKGSPGAGFGSAPGSKVARFAPDTMERYSSYLVGQLTSAVGTEADDAESAFNAAIEDILTDSTNLTALDIDAGNRLRARLDTAAAADPAVAARIGTTLARMRTTPKFNR